MICYEWCLAFNGRRAPGIVRPVNPPGWAPLMPVTGKTQGFFMPIGIEKINLCLQTQMVHIAVHKQFLVFHIVQKYFYGKESFDTFFLYFKVNIFNILATNFEQT